MIAGIVTVCIEESPEAEALRKKYHCVASVRPGSEFQDQCNAKHLDFFYEFVWVSVLADTQA